jgi:hypothetical protein
MKTTKIDFPFKKIQMVVIPTNKLLLLLSRKLKGTVFHEVKMG